ncbi:hypothetical protein AMECASPLE_011556 [Ameca splendens]|uniref:Uncharacterized protein n=1 Tax=Ameca splendens TaxID=208324 RepID=A0ABV0YZG3_9TELE
MQTSLICTANSITSRLLRARSLSRRGVSRDQTPKGSLGRPRDAVIQDPLRGHESVQKMEGSGWQLLLIKANFKGF